MQAKLRLGPSSAQRALLQQTVKSQGNAIAANRQTIADTRQLLGSIGNLRQLVSDVRSDTQIHYRIYAEANDSQLLLVDGEFDRQEKLVP